MAQVAAGAVAFIHYAVMAYMVVGGFLVWRWRWALVPHLMIIGWAVLSLLYPVVCPLTTLQNHFHSAAGLPPLRGGFIDSYISGVLYPEQLEMFVQLVCAAIVLFSWVGAYLHRRHRDRPLRSSDERMRLV